MEIIGVLKWLIGVIDLLSPHDPPSTSSNHDHGGPVVVLSILRLRFCSMTVWSYLGYTGA